MNALEQEFDDLVKDTTELKKYNYNPSYFLQMVYKMGGVAAAKQLLAKEMPQSGLTRLWEVERLDLSIEAQVLNPHFHDLFTDEERSIAQARLDAYK